MSIDNIVNQLGFTQEERPRIDTKNKPDDDGTAGTPSRRDKPKGFPPSNLGVIPPTGKREPVITGLR